MQPINDTYRFHWGPTELNEHLGWYFMVEAVDELYIALLDDCRLRIEYLFGEAPGGEYLVMKAQNQWITRDDFVSIVTQRDGDFFFAHMKLEIDDGARINVDDEGEIGIYHTDRAVVRRYAERAMALLDIDPVLLDALPTNGRIVTTDIEGKIVRIFDTFDEWWAAGS